MVFTGFCFLLITLKLKFRERERERKNNNKNINTSTQQTTYPTKQTELFWKWVLSERNQRFFSLQTMRQHFLWDEMRSFSVTEYTSISHLSQIHKKFAEISIHLEWSLKQQSVGKGGLWWVLFASFLKIR